MRRLAPLIRNIRPLPRPHILIITIVPVINERHAPNRPSHYILGAQTNVRLPLSVILRVKGGPVRLGGGILAVLVAVEIDAEGAGGTPVDAHVVGGRGPFDAIVVAGVDELVAVVDGVARAELVGEGADPGAAVEEAPGAEVSGGGGVGVRERGVGRDDGGRGGKGRSGHSGAQRHGEEGCIMHFIVQFF